MYGTPRILSDRHYLLLTNNVHRDRHYCYNSNRHSVNTFLDITMPAKQKKGICFIDLHDDSFG